MHNKLDNLYSGKDWGVFMETVSVLSMSKTKVHVPTCIGGFMGATGQGVSKWDYLEVNWADGQYSQSH